MILVNDEDFEPMKRSLELRNFLSLLLSSISGIAVLMSFISLANTSAIAADPQIPGAFCNESVFKPCICPNKVPRNIKYRAAFKGCNGDAAALLEGEFADSFSVVLRDRANRDRFPPSGYNGCSDLETELGLNRCSAWKCQKVYKTKVRRKVKGKPGVRKKIPQTVCCFGDSGNAPVMSKATRMTIKIRDIPGSTEDPLVRVCLQDFDPTKDLN